MAISVILVFFFTCFKSTWKRDEEDKKEQQHVNTPVTVDQTLTANMLPKTDARPSYCIERSSLATVPSVFTNRHLALAEDVYMFIDDDVLYRDSPESQPRDTHY